MNLLQLPYLLQEEVTPVEEEFLTGDNVSTFGLVVMYIVSILLIGAFCKMCYSFWLQNPIDKNRKLKCYNHDADKAWNKFIKNGK